MIKATLRYPPTLNHLYFTAKSGRRVLSKEGATYKEEAGWVLKAAGAKPIEGPVVVYMTVYRPRKVGDLDNTLKAVFDSCKGIAWIDDKQVVEIHAYREDDKENPRVELTVMPRL